MNDLISRQAAIDAMTSILWHYPNECYRKLNEYEFAKRLAELGLKSVPSAQEKEYTELIRCKDCKYYREDGDCWHEWDNDGKIYYQSVINKPNPDDYCSYGERKEE